MPVFEALRAYYLEAEIAGGPILETAHDMIADQIGDGAASEALAGPFEGLRDPSDDRPAFQDMFEFA